MYFDFDFHVEVPPEKLVETIWKACEQKLEEEGLEFISNPFVYMPASDLLDLIAKTRREKGILQRWIKRLREEGVVIQVTKLKK